MMDEKVLEHANYLRGRIETLQAGMKTIEDLLFNENQFLKATELSVRGILKFKIPIKENHAKLILQELHTEYEAELKAARKEFKEL